MMRPSTFSRTSTRASWQAASSILPNPAALWQGCGGSSRARFEKEEVAILRGILSSFDAGMKNKQ
jgi:hypothetical protein